MLCSSFRISLDLNYTNHNSSQSPPFCPSSGLSVLLPYGKGRCVCTRVLQPAIQIGGEEGVGGSIRGLYETPDEQDGRSMERVRRIPSLYIQWV